MKNKNNLLTILIAIFLIILVVIVIIFTKKSSNVGYSFEPSGWTVGVNRIDYMNISNYGKNICNKEYYSPIFKINDNVLYDFGDTEIQEGIFTLYTVNYGECDTQLLFATALNGDVYYVNNLVDSEYKKYQMINIPELIRVVDITYDEEGNLIASESTGAETTINEYVDRILSIEE